MAAQAGLAFGEPLAIIPCIAPHSASAVFTEGVLRRYCAWDVLEAGLDGDRPARDLMREILGLSDIRNYPPPVRPEAAFLVGAKGDAYIPPESVLLLHRHWPGSDLQWLDTGHVGAFLFHRGAFLRAIRNAFSRL
jgi:pimeloyl-ACP methyl ester carboxylesterase